MVSRACTPRAHRVHATCTRRAHRAHTARTPLAGGGIDRSICSLRPRVRVSDHVTRAVEEDAEGGRLGRPREWWSFICDVHEAPTLCWCDGHLVLSCLSEGGD